MKSGDLPNEKAFEPNEGAHQPMLDKSMPPFTDQYSKKLTFAKNVGTTEKPSSQTSSAYKDILSQPASELSHCQKLLWLQKRRTTGLWAQCDECDRWRYLPNVIDRHELPTKWYCSMNPDPEYASCSVPEAPLRLRDEEDLIHGEYAAGSLVWARLPGWPWWPALVDDCPDAEQYYWLDGFSDIPTHYNVVFFDNMDVTRAWVAPENLKPFTLNKNAFKNLQKSKKYNARLRVAISQADAAEKMVLAERLEKFSFLSRYKGNISSPKKVNKRDLQKYQRRFKKKFNVEFPIESSDSDEDVETNLDTESAVKKGNVIMLGTPKRARKDKNQVSSLQILAKSKCDDSTPTHEKELDSASTHEKEENSTSLPEKEQTADESQRFKENANTEIASNSMIAQVGSTEATSMDNDTSTTYLPEQGSENPNFSIRTESPNSDDFDF